MRGHALSIPDFSRYEVLSDPFEVWDTKHGKKVTVVQRKGRGKPTVHLVDDTGKRRTLSIVTIACLAYHGLPPNGFIAQHTGGDISKTTVRWVSKEEYQGSIRASLTLNQKDRVVELYFDKGLTQREIAEKFNVSQPAISRIINKMGK